jgi:uncharacterized oxidoreductase
MKTTGNTILITGGNAGIGRGLAESLQKLGNHVIIAGRNQAMLDETIAANPGMDAIVLDIEDPAAIRAFAAQVVKDYPALNVVINNAGIMRPENLKAQPDDLADMEAIVTTNLFGPIRLTAALLPHLLGQEAATLINVSSGLAFVPLPMTPTYSATKAAIHSYTDSLRVQLKDTAVEVLEIIPPGVQTKLMKGQDSNPQMMPFDEFIQETMGILTTQPTPQEICVERVKGLRFAEANGQYGEMLTMLSGFSH